MNSRIIYFWVILVFPGLIYSQKVDTTIEKRLYEQAVIYSQSNQFQNAISIYDSLINIRPTHDLYYFGRGLAKFRMGKKLESIKDFIVAQKIDGTNYKYPFQMGNAFSDLGDIKNAKKSYLLSISLGAPKDTTYCNLANTYVFDNIDSATKYYERSLECNPVYKDGLAGISYVYILKENYSKSKEYLEKANELYPENVVILNNLSYTYLKVNKKNKALKIANKSISNEPTNPWSYRNRGLIFLSLGELDKACMDYENALKNNFVNVWGEKNLEELKVSCLQQKNKD